MNKPSDKISRCAFLAGGFLLWALAPFAHAQDTAPSNDDTILLNPFVVQTETDDAWVSSQAVSGTRTRTALANLPVSMQVFTDAFIKDLAADNLLDVVTFAAGVSQNVGQDTFNEDNTNFTLRGQPSFVPMRNGFRRLRLAGSQNIERVEIIKGPSSLLYGQLNPGGNVNYITKRPKLTGQFADVRLKAGSNEHYSSVLDFNSVIVPKKLAIRFVASYLEESKEGLDTFNAETLVNPSLTWWILPNTTLTVEYEEANRNRNNQQSTLPFHETLDITEVPWAGVDRTFTTGAPTDFYDTLMRVYTAEFVHVFNRHFTLRANYTEEVWSEKNLNNQTANGITGANLDRLNNRRGRYGERGSWDNWTQVELAHDITLGGVGVKTLVGLQREELQYRNLISTSTVAFPNTGWLLSDQSTWVVTTAERDDFTVNASSGSTSTNLTNSYYITNQLSFLEGRLRTLAGMRVDDFKVTAYNAGNGQTTSDDAEPARVPQVGILYKLADHLSIYATYSESFLPIFSTSRREDGSFYSPKPQTGEGMDLGIKGSVFDGKLDFTAAIYEVSNTNIVRFLPQVTIGNEVFAPTNQSGKETSKGFELDLRYKPSKSTQLIFSYGFTDAYVANDPQTLITYNGEQMRARDGNRLPYAPEHTAAVFLRQDFGAFGKLTKTYATLGANYQSEVETSDAYFVRNGELRKRWTIDARTVVSLGLGAEFKVADQRVNVSLNVKNLFDLDYLANIYRYAPGREFFLQLSTRF